jgi:aldehyde dehydrogenase (NAD+)
LKALGTNPEESTDFRIVNFKNWQRQINLLENQNTLWRKSIKKLLHCPTLLNEPKMDSLVMKEEIFGPIPIISFKTKVDIEK